MALRDSMLWLAGNRRIERAVLSAGISRSMARRFVAGETIEEALQTARRINQRGASVTLDYLGENVHEEAEAAAVVRTYVELLRSIAARQLDCNVSIKLTALGLDIGRDVCMGNLRQVLDTARESDNFVRLDMEGSQYTAATLEIFEQLFDKEGYRNVGIVLQSYLRRSAADTRRAIQIGARVRLCKGAYKEPPDIAYPEKADVDRNYVALARELLQRGNYPGLATHDERIIKWVTRFARQEGIATDRYEFQMLYGIRRDLQRRIVDEGYRLRLYVPFGNAWYPYLMRRMAERPANLLFVLRSLVRG